MTQPQTQTVQPVAPPPVQTPLVQRIAEILLAGYAISKTADAIEAVLKAAFGALRIPSNQAIMAAIGLANTAHRPRPRFASNGFDATTPAANAIMRATANADLYYRAAYLLNAAERMQKAIDNGASVKEAIGAEARHYQAHRQARENRLEVAGKVGRSAELLGPILGWYRNHALDSEAECIAADGHNFRADTPPLIGYPGAVHPFCGCEPGPPHENAGWVDDAVAALTPGTARIALRRAS